MKPQNHQIFYEVRTEYIKNNLTIKYHMMKNYGINGLLEDSIFLLRRCC